MSKNFICIDGVGRLYKESDSDEVYTDYAGRDYRVFMINGVRKAERLKDTNGVLRRASDKY